jgi:YjbE family integral membrane protein
VEISQQAIIALAQVIFIDVVLAGDNAIVVGMAAARVSPALRMRVIFWGVGAAVGLRILFALVATQLLAIVGLTLAGGLLLLWVCWKMYREIRHASPAPALAGGPSDAPVGTELGFWAALTQIIVADVSMSLDNVLAVAGVAKGETWVLIAGLTLSVVLMGAAATFIARLLTRYAWIAWIGLLVILHVAIEMIWSGSRQVACISADHPLCRVDLLDALRQVI